MFQALLAELKRFFESILGKWSIETWMGTIRNAASEIIRDTAAQEHLTYQSGTCTVTYRPGHDVTAQLKLLFQREGGELEQLEALREFPEKRFCSEALAQLQAEEELVFPLEPDGAR